MRTRTLRFALGVTALALTVALGGCSSSGVDGPGGVSDVTALEKIQAQEFPLCGWVQTALASSDPGLAMMLQPIYAGDDPASSTFLQAGGLEEYSQEGSVTQVECWATANYGEVEGGFKITLRADPDGLEAGSDRDGVEYAGRTIREGEYPSVGAYVTNNVRIRVSLGHNADFYLVAQDNLDGAATTLVKLMLDTWDSGKVETMMSNVGLD